MKRTTAAVALLAVFLPPLSAQEHDDPSERYLDRPWKARFQAASDFIEGLNARNPEVADAALKTDVVSFSDEGKLLVQLRNDDWREITAWSLGVVVDSGQGRGQNTVHTEDKYIAGTAEEHTPLKPGASRVVELNLPRTSAKVEYPYPTLVVTTKAVVFSDGSFAGNDLRAIRGVLQRRYARAAALSLLADRVEAALQADSLGSLLDEPIDGTGIPRVAAVSVAANVQQEAILRQRLWPSSVLRAAQRAGVFAGVAPGAEFDAVDFLKTNEEALRVATETALSGLLSELAFVRSHLPESLR